MDLVGVDMHQFGLPTITGIDCETPGLEAAAICSTENLGHVLRIGLEAGKAAIRTSEEFGKSDF